MSNAEQVGYLQGYEDGYASGKADGYGTTAIDWNKLLDDERVKAYEAGCKETAEKIIQEGDNHKFQDDADALWWQSFKSWLSPAKEMKK